MEDEKAHKKLIRKPHEVLVFYMDAKKDTCRKYMFEPCHVISNNVAF